MKKHLFILAIFALLGSNAFAQIGWTTIENAATMDNAKSQKLYFVDFYTSWCGWCKKMDNETFKDPTVAKIMNTHYIAIKFNAEGSSNFSWNGKNYSGSTGRQKAHSFAVAILGQKMGFPSFGIFDANQNLITVIPGYVKAEDFTKILWYFANGDHKRYSWEQYEKIFDKDIKPSMEKKLGIK